MSSFYDSVTAKELFSSTTSLISQFREARKGKQPLHEQVVELKNRIRETVDNIVDLDIEFAQQKDLEGIFWKEVFYRLLDDYQKYLKKSSADGHASKVKERQLVQAYLEETFGFYIRLLHRITAHYRLDVDIDFVDSSSPSARATAKQSVPDLSQGIAVSFKCLLHLGDLARYREQYSELPRKDFSGAIRYYESAQRLVPQNGNPHNQLAVVSTYKNDKISALYHYYRAITCDEPFLIAKKNVALLFEANAATSATNMRNDDDNSLNNDPQKFATEYLKLHGSLLLEKNFKDVPALQSSVVEKFSLLLRNGALSVHQCLKVSMVNIAAYHLTKESHPNSEPFACALLMEMFFVMSMEAEKALRGPKQARNQRNGNSHGPMQQNLTALIPIRARRMLPAIYLLAKFIRLDPELAEFKHSASFVQVIFRGWKAYAKVIKEIRALLSATLDRSVPLAGDQLLEEDMACFGFSPMLQSSDGACKKTISTPKPFSGSSEWPVRLSNMVMDAMSIDVPEVRALFNDRSDDPQDALHSVEPELPHCNNQVDVIASSARADSVHLSARNSPTSRQIPELPTGPKIPSQAAPPLEEGNLDDEEVILLSLPSRRRQLNGNNPVAFSRPEVRISARDMPTRFSPLSETKTESVDCGQPSGDSNLERSLSPAYSWACFDGAEEGEIPFAGELIDADDAAIHEMVKDIVDVDSHGVTAASAKTDDYSLRLWNAIPKGLLEESPTRAPSPSSSSAPAPESNVTAFLHLGVDNTAISGSTCSQAQDLNYSAASETANYTSLFSHDSPAGMTAPLSPASWHGVNAAQGFSTHFPPSAQSPTTGSRTMHCAGGGPMRATPELDVFTAFIQTEGGQYHNFGFTSDSDYKSLSASASSLGSETHIDNFQQTFLSIDSVPWFGSQMGADASTTTDTFVSCITSQRGGGTLSEVVIGEERRNSVRSTGKLSGSLL